MTAWFGFLEVVSGRTVRGLTAARSTVWTLDFAPDSRWLATSADDGFVTLWRLRAGTG